MLVHERNSSANENVIIGFLNYREMQFNGKVTYERFLTCFNKAKLGESLKVCFNLKR